MSTELWKMLKKITEISRLQSCGEMWKILKKSMSTELWRDLNIFFNIHVNRAILKNSLKIDVNGAVEIFEKKKTLKHSRQSSYSKKKKTFIQVCVASEIYKNLSLWRELWKKLRLSRLWTWRIIIKKSTSRDLDESAKIQTNSRKPDKGPSIALEKKIKRKNQ